MRTKTTDRLAEQKANAAGEATVSVDRVTKEFGATRALDSVSVQVKEGEIVALLGPSGCGKTTLLRCISGLESVTGGSISIADFIVSAPGTHVPPHLRRIGLVFQSYALWPHMTVQANVMYGLRVARIDKREARRRTAEALETVGLSEYGSRLPSQLSGGQQQRVAIARSLVVRPRLLLLDEPMSNLDANTRDRMRKELRAILKDFGITSVHVTHDQKEALAIADRVVLMSQGIVVQEGTPETLYGSPRDTFAATFLGRANLLRARASDVGAGGEAGIPDVGAVRAGRVEARKDDDSELYVMFRPEHVEILKSSEGRTSENCWPAQVLSRTFEGATVEYTLRLQGSGELVRAYDTHGAVGEGDPVHLHVASRYVALIPGHEQAPGSMLAR